LPKSWTAAHELKTGDCQVSGFRAALHGAIFASVRRFDARPMTDQQRSTSGKVCWPLAGFGTRRSTTQVRQMTQRHPHSPTPQSDWRQLEFSSPNGGCLATPCSGMPAPTRAPTSPAIPASAAAFESTTRDVPAAMAGPTTGMTPARTPSPASAPRRRPVKTPVRAPHSAC
jgi:hypothetical protein